MDLDILEMSLARRAQDVWVLVRVVLVISSPG